MKTDVYRYIIAGIVNTIAGYLSFLCAFHFFSINAMLSNLFSYAMGLIVAYIMNLLFVFRGSTFSVNSVIRFLIGFVIAYSINFILFYFCFKSLNFPPEISQVFAMTGYTVSFYVINKYFVWRTY